MNPSPQPKSERPHHCRVPVPWNRLTLSALLIPWQPLLDLLSISTGEFAFSTLSHKRNHTVGSILYLPFTEHYYLEITMLLHASIVNSFCTGWCGSVDWVPACDPKDHWFYFQSGHAPGLWARSPAGGTREAPTQWCFSAPLSPSFPLSKNKNK